MVKATDLSIIITTSPIRCHPSTKIIDDSINSIQRQQSLKDVHIYIVCDGAKVKQQNQYKSGIVTQETMDNYKEYIQNLRQKYSNGDRFSIIEREMRYGFAQNIRYVMQKYIVVDYVLIYQHDYVIQEQIDFNNVIEIMNKFHNQINYVTFMHKNYLTLIQRLVSFPKIKVFLEKMLGKDDKYNYAADPKSFNEDVKKYFLQKFGLGLVPLYFWYDKVHIAKKRYYLDVIFNDKGNYDFHRQKNMKTLTFVQDTFGHCMKSTIAEQPHKIFQYGAYVLWSDKPVFYHQSGRAFMREDQRQMFYKAQKQKVSQQSESEESVSGIDLQDMMKIQ